MNDLPLFYSGRVRNALHWMERNNRGTSRKGADVPYSMHPISVWALGIAVGADDDLQIALILHDEVEDNGVTLTQINDEFGAKVARIVSALTKRKTDDEGNVLSREQVHRITEEKMAAADADEAAGKGCDLAINLTDIVLDCRRHGSDHLLLVFKSAEKIEFKLDHYLRLADIVIGRLSYFGAYPKLIAELRARSADVARIRDEWLAGR